jgi:UDP-N-acetylmuramoylalanine--D-glutamate ligase
LSNYKNVTFYAYGEAKNEIKEVLNCEVFDSFYHAYEAINAKKGEIIIFSPGCASFDEFSGYEERGRLFSKIVREYINVKG